MAFDFSVPDRVRRRQADIRAFVDQVVIPREQEAFRGGLDDGLRVRLQATAREAGLWAPQAATALGGGGFRFDEAAVLLEAAGRSPLGPLALNCAAPDEGNIHLLDVIATPAQRERYLEPLVRGDARSCFAMTEPPPGAGSRPDPSPTWQPSSTGSSPPSATRSPTWGPCSPTGTTPATKKGA
jgi:acyl-CoA dehydrogenase